MGDLVLYHGTSRECLIEILRTGLRNPHLTDSIEVAEYYAEVADDDDDSGQVVLRVVVTDTSALFYDGSAMDEPVIVGAERVRQAWDRAGREHPEWLQGGCIICPPEAWSVSLEGAASVRAEGVFTDFTTDLTSLPISKPITAIPQPN
jgi:hypothetical protein